MRRKNRQVKLTLDIPEKFDEDDDFMEAFMNVLDNNGWKLNLEEGATGADVHRVQLGEVVIEPEEEE